MVGTPEEVAAKIVAKHALFGDYGWLGHISVGALPGAKVVGRCQAVRD
jgi:hypothetical protein